MTEAREEWLKAARVVLAWIRTDTANSDVEPGEHGREDLLTESIIERMADAFIAYVGAERNTRTALAGEGWLVWSNEHQAWWRPNRQGYTVFVEAAGRYSHEEALDICRKARHGWERGVPPSEVPVREADALACLPPPPKEER